MVRSKPSLAPVSEHQSAGGQGHLFSRSGAWTPDACIKFVRFVDRTQTFHLPIVHPVDCPGFRVVLAARMQRGNPRWGARAMSAINQTTVPSCSIVVRNCYGVGGLGHRPVRHLRQCFAWPSASRGRGR